MKIIKHIYIFLFLATTTACGNDLLPFGQYRIDWDQHNADLHGQTVSFNQPMSYILLNDEHIIDFRIEVIEIGRLLRKTDNNLGGIKAKAEYKREEIRRNMKFKIKASYWYRRGSLDLNGDRHYIVVSDENNVQSTIGSWELSSSDRQDLIKYKEIGRYK